MALDRRYMTSDETAEDAAFRPARWSECEQQDMAPAILGCFRYRFHLYRLVRKARQQATILGRSRSLVTIRAIG
jgi:hypothetical protein